jgi:2-methylisocitrate lyase-like PEP mutase family enzyme
MKTSQAERIERFRALHAAPEAFVIANAWDAGSARILAGMGFKALATSSGAAAGVLGRRDGMLTRDEAMSHAQAIVGATDLPVSADLENGFGDTVEAVTETIGRACRIGLAGGSIEDASSDAVQPIYALDHATARVAAAVAAARESGFVVTARAENFVRGRPDLGDTLRRLQAFEKAGADVLMAPGLPDLDSVRTVCAGLSRPFNFMMGIRGKSFSVAALAQAGVKRVSLATSLYRAAMGGMIAAAREMHDAGTSGYIDGIMTTAELNAFFPD